MTKRKLDWVTVTGEAPRDFTTLHPEFVPLTDETWKLVTTKWGAMSAVDVREAFGTVAPMFEKAHISVTENTVIIRSNYDLNPERQVAGVDNGPRPVVAMFRAGRMMRGAWVRRVDSRSGGGRGYRAGTCSLHVCLWDTAVSDLTHLYSGVYTPEMLEMPEDYTEEAVKEQMAVIDGFIDALENYRG